MPYHILLVLHAITKCCRLLSTPGAEPIILCKGSAWSADSASRSQIMPGVQTIILYITTKYMEEQLFGDFPLVLVRTILNL